VYGFDDDYCRKLGATDGECFEENNEQVFPAGDDPNGSPAYAVTPSPIGVWRTIDDHIGKPRGLDHNP
jgi:hypothetical protein